MDYVIETGGSRLIPGISEGLFATQLCDQRATAQVSRARVATSNESTYNTDVTQYAQSGADVE